MSRKQFAGWGWELSDREFGQALAVLGVAAGVLGEPPGEPGPLPLTRDAARAVLTQAWKQARRRPGKALVWNLAPWGGVKSLRTRLARQSAPELAAAWVASGAAGHHLEVRPTSGVDTAWLLETLAGALTASLPHVALPEPEGRPRWNWPLRIGFPADQASHRARIYDWEPALSQSVRHLTDPEVGPSRCDMLLLQTEPHRGLREIAATDLPEAALVLVFVGERSRADPLRGRAIAERTNAAGVALIEVSPEWQTEWLRTFLRDLSHRNPVTEALRRSGQIRGLLAAPRLLDSTPLMKAAYVLGAALGMTFGRAAAEPIRVRAMPQPTMQVLGVRPTAGTVRMSAIRETFGRAPMGYASESGGASHVAAVARAAAPALDALEEEQGGERYVRAGVAVDRGTEARAKLVRIRRGFEAGERHRVAVSIGPPDPKLVMARTPVNRKALDEAVNHRLTIVLSEPALLRKPLVGHVELPKFGPTRDVPFELPVRRSTRAVDGRIIVLHRGRILQTAILRGPVYARADLDRLEAAGGDDPPGIEIEPEADLRPGLAGLDDRTRFHSAIVLNHNGDGHAGATAVGRRKAITFDLDFVKDAVAALSRKLEDAEKDEAFDRKLDSPKSLGYLRLLAYEGRNLYIGFGKEIESTFGGSPERIQVLSANANTMLPIELIYDLPPPGAAPRLCPGAAEALRTGKCKDPAHVPNVLGQIDVVCPSGFWGVSKIIERQATDRKRLKSGYRVTRVARRDKQTLGGLAPVLFAASDHVNDVDRKELTRVSAALKKVTDSKITKVDKWIDWATAVRDSEPPLLVLLSHTELLRPGGPWLEIAKAGGAEIQAVGGITESFVNVNKDRPGPIVLLLGCTTAVPLDTFQSFTVAFSAMGAPVVIGTIAPILGRHAGRTAEALIEALQEVQAAAGSRPDVPIGEAVRDVRRALLAKGILMSMSLASYGDADWRVPVQA